MRILLVEDDALLGDGIAAGLKMSGYTVEWVRDGEAAQAALMSETFAAMVLDLGLPRLSGLALLTWLRARRDALPVLILTARDTLEDRVTGLDTGADDYLVKPFALAELAARLRALVRRGVGVAAPLLRWREVVLDPASHQVSAQGTAVMLTALEFALLHALLLGQGRVFERVQLEQKLYQWGEEIDSNAVEVLVHRLRKKLGNDIIRTVRGVGYALGVA
jgi:DNA-binding response OmpR family regulator